MYAINTIPVWNDYNIAPLVVAVIQQAAIDAQAGDAEAREWLQCEGIAWAEAIGVDLRLTVQRWIVNGCKPPRTYKPGGRRAVSLPFAT